MSQLGISESLFESASPVCAEPASIQSRIRELLGRATYPRHYAWVLALAALDVLLTWAVLSTGGVELNALARVAIEHAGVAGMIAIKVCTLTVVILVCEYVALHRPRLGRGVAELALAGNAAAVSCGVMYLAQFGLEVMRCA